VRELSQYHPILDDILFFSLPFQKKKASSGFAHKTISCKSQLNKD
jgi:hypothetical protein